MQKRESKKQKKVGKRKRVNLQAQDHPVGWGGGIVIESTEKKSQKKVVSRGTKERLSSRWEEIWGIDIYPQMES